MKTTTMSFFAALALTTLSGLALAKGGTPQNHHCMKDGAEVPGKTKKECKKDGGTWDKDKVADAPKADAPMADAPKA